MQIDTDLISGDQRLSVSIFLLEFMKIRVLRGKNND
jgi:hypothetical protein